MKLIRIVILFFSKEESNSNVNDDVKHNSIRSLKSTDFNMLEENNNVNNDVKHNSIRSLKSTDLNMLENNNNDDKIKHNSIRSLKSVDLNFDNYNTQRNNNSFIDIQQERDHPLYVPPVENMNNFQTEEVVMNSDFSIGYRDPRNNIYCMDPVYKGVNSKYHKSRKYERKSFSDKKFHQYRHEKNNNIQASIVSCDSEAFQFGSSNNNTQNSICFNSNNGNSSGHQNTVLSNDLPPPNDIIVAQVLQQESPEIKFWTKRTIWPLVMLVASLISLVVFCALNFTTPPFNKMDKIYRLPPQCKYWEQLYKPPKPPKPKPSPKGKNRMLPQEEEAVLLEQLKKKKKLKKKKARINPTASAKNIKTKDELEEEYEKKILELNEKNKRKKKRNLNPPSDKPITPRPTTDKSSTLRPKKHKNDNSQITKTNAPTYSPEECGKIAKDLMDLSISDKKAKEKLIQSYLIGMIISGGLTFIFLSFFIIFSYNKRRENIKQKKSSFEAQQQHQLSNNTSRATDLTLATVV